MSTPLAQPVTRSLRVGISRDFLDAEGTNVWGDIGLAGFDPTRVSWSYLPTDVAELGAAEMDGYDALIVAAPAVTARSFASVSAPPRLIARFGVGYDAIDVDACTRAGTLVTITPDGARRPVATAALTMLLACLHHLVVKDQLVRRRDWEPRRRWMGRGLTGRVIGLVGLGNTGSDLVALLQPFDCTLVAYDPYCPPERARELGVQLVSLDQLAAHAQALVVLAPLTPQTHHLVDARLLSALPPGAVVINLSRGPIVDEVALLAGLESGHLGGAGLDVFEHEPTDSPLCDRPDVILSPHCLAWTDEMAAGNGGSCVRAVLDLAAGRVPRYVVNPDALAHPRLAMLQEAR